MRAKSPSDAHNYSRCGKDMFAARNLKTFLKMCLKNFANKKIIAS